MNKSRHGSLVVVPNLDYVSSVEIANLAVETERQAEVSRCRLPRWQGSDSGFLSAGPGHFPEPSPVSTA